MSVKPSQNSPNEPDLEITQGTCSDLELSSCSTATTGSDVVSCILKKIVNPKIIIMIID